MQLAAGWAGSLGVKPLHPLVPHFLADQAVGAGYAGKFRRSVMGIGKSRLALISRIGKLSTNGWDELGRVSDRDDEGTGPADHTVLKIVVELHHFENSYRSCWA